MAPIEQQRIPQNEDGTSVLKTFFNGFNTMLGIGILSVPYAISVGGWVSICFLFAMAAVCLYTAILLKRCMDTDPYNIRTYPDIAYRAFGDKGRVLVSLLTYSELYLVITEFIIVEGDNLYNLFPKFCLHFFGKTVQGRKLFVLLVTLVVLPSTWINDLGFLGYFSAGGILSSFTLLGVVIWIGRFGGVHFKSKGVVGRFGGMPTSINLFTFCFAGHAVFPTLYASMQKKQHFNKVLVSCFILSTITYGLMGTFGYLMFGDRLKSQITLNLPTENISSKIAIYLTLINPITRYAVCMLPVAKAIERKMNVQTSRWKCLTLRTFLVTGTAIMAIFVPDFAYIMAFIGAFLCINVSIIFPCCCYLKLNPAARNWGLEFILIIVVIIVAIVIGVMGTFISVKNIILHAG